MVKPMAVGANVSISAKINTAATTGTVNSMHGSRTPLGGFGCIVRLNGNMASAFFVQLLLSQFLQHMAFVQ